MKSRIKKIQEAIDEVVANLEKISRLFSSIAEDHNPESRTETKTMLYEKCSGSITKNLFENHSLSYDDIDEKILEFEKIYREAFKNCLVDSKDQTPANIGFRLATLVVHCGLDPNSRKSMSRVAKRMQHLLNVEKVTRQNMYRKNFKVWQLKDLDYR